MLTEIEWWGGLIFIWLGVCYVTMIKAFKDYSPFEMDILSSHIAFLMCAVVLALYFYPLQSPLMQNVYMLATVLGIIASLVMSFWPESAERKEKEANKPKDDDEEELGKVWEIAGQAVFLLPVIITLALALYKSIAYLDNIGNFQS